MNTMRNKKAVYTITAIVLIAGYLWILIPASHAQDSIPASRAGGAWSKTLKDASFAAPTAANKAVYIGSNGGVLYILDAESGKPKQEFKSEFRVPCYPLVSGDGSVYLTTNNGALYALNAFTGELKWSLSDTAVKDYSNPPELPYYYVYQPAQTGNLVFFSTPTSTLYAVDTETGSVQWSYQSHSTYITYPSVSKNKVLIGNEDGMLIALDITTGEEQWQFQTDGPIHYPPAAQKDEILLGSTDGTLYVLDLYTGGLRWKYSSANRIESSPVIAEDFAYIATSNGKLSALNIRKRRLKWKFDVEGFVVTQPAIHKDLVYAGSNDGKLYALSASEGELIWIYDSKGNFVNEVAIANEKIYAVTNAKIDDKPVAEVLVLKSGRNPGSRVTTYARKEHALFAWITDFFSAPAKELMQVESPTLADEVENFLAWPVGFYNLAIVHSLTDMFSKPSTVGVERSLNDASEFLNSGISIFGFTCLFSLMPYFAIFLSGFLVLIWSVVSLIIFLISNRATRFVSLAIGARTSQNMITHPFALVKEAFILSLQHLKLAALILAQLVTVLLLSWGLYRYLSPIKIWSFYLVITFAWTIAVMLSCLTHAYSLIQLNRTSKPGEAHFATDYFGRVLAISLTYILFSLLVIACLGADKAYDLDFLSVIGVALISLAFVLLPFASCFAILHDQSYVSSIKSSISLVLNNLGSTLIYLITSALIFSLLSTTISLLGTLQSSFLLLLVSLLFGSLGALYLVNLQSTTFSYLTGERR